jgi:hypothetical protein
MYNIYSIEPIKIKSLYLTFWGASPKSKTFKKILNILKKKNLNSIVIDVKTEYGYTSYKTSFKQGNSYGIWYKRPIKDIKKFIQFMKDNNIYTIARIVVFKDNIQASHNFSYSIKNKHNKSWSNRDKMKWVDPFSNKAQEYTLNIAEDAAIAGFDEINYDYIRFPAKRGLKYLKQSTRFNRVQAISSFLLKSKKRLLKYGVYTSVNTYGIIFRNKKDDSQIGKEIEELKKYVKIFNTRSKRK